MITLTTSKSSFVRLFKGTSYLTCFRIITAIVSIGSISILTRTLPKESIGVYFILLQIAAIASLFCKLGADQGNQKFISMALVNNPANLPKLLKRQRLLVFIGTPATLLVLTLLWSSLSRHIFSSALLGQLLFFQLCIILILATEQMQSSTLRAVDKLFQSAASENFIRQLFFFFFLGALFVYDKSLIQIKIVLLVWIISGLISITVGFIWVRRAVYTYHKFDLQADNIISLKGMAKISLPMGIATCMATIRGSSDVLIIGWLLGPVGVGLYGPLKRISQLLVFLLGSITKMLSPIIASLYTQKKLVEMEAVCRKGATFASIFGIPFALFFFFFGDWFLVFAFGNKYTDLGLLLSILILGPLSSVLCGSPGVVLQMTGHEVLSMKVNTLMSILVILLMLTVALPFGLYGIATVSSTVLCTQFFVLTYLVYRRIGIRTYTSIFSFKPL